MHTGPSVHTLAKFCREWALLFCFIEEEIGIQRGERPYPDHTARKWHQQNLNPGLSLLQASSPYLEPVPDLNGQEGQQPFPHQQVGLAVCGLAP